MARQSDQIGYGAQARSSGHGHTAIADRQQITHHGFAAQVGVGVKFEQAFTADRRQYLQRSQQ